MIQNDQELKVTRDRIGYFVRLLATLTANSQPDEVVSVTGSYRTEVERMQREVQDYLTRPTVSAKAG